MSLKAKIEAIIYAAEEPVTLDQIAVVVGDAAFEIPSVPAATDQPGDASEVLASEPVQGEETTAAESAVAESSPTESEPAAEAAPSVPEAESAQPTLLDASNLDEKAKLKKAKENIRVVIDELIREYDQSDRAMEIRQIAGGYRMSTKPEHHDVIRGFVKSMKPPMKLSLQALETLAVIAYKQPVTAPEISEIRGVDAGGVLGSLISRKLITTAGRKQVIGRPILYKTTKDFLLRFGLKDISELPSIEEFEKLASENTELFSGEEPDADKAATPEASEAEAEGSAPMEQADGAGASAETTSHEANA